MSSSRSSGEFSRKPEWLRVRLPQNNVFASTSKLLSDLRLNTVCHGARCPNTCECYGRGVATFMILGRYCTRSCAFCGIGGKGGTEPLDPGEPGRVAEAAARLRLRHVVVTSVTRDDLRDGGAGCFAAVIREIRAVLPGSSVEVLTPDFRGDLDSLDLVLAERPDVMGHNVETVPDLYSRVRPQADYETSLGVLERAAKAGLKAKSGFMLGLGETDEQVLRLLSDLANSGCSAVTVGQYLRPGRSNPEPARYVPPREFGDLAREGEALGLAMRCGPLVRSSYRADEFAGRK